MALANHRRRAPQDQSKYTLAETGPAESPVVFAAVAVRRRGEISSRDPDGSETAICAAARP
jgi:hypothetical protein